MEEENYELDQDLNSSLINDENLENYINDPKFKKYINKISKCKTEQQKKNILEEINEEMLLIPDNRTLKQKYEDKKNKLKGLRTKKN